MKRSVVISTLFIFVLGFLVIPTLYAGLTYQHEGNYPDDMMLYPPLEYEQHYGKRKLAPVPFSHDLHFEYNCDVCHHTGDTFMGCMEFGCHDMAVNEPVTNVLIAGTRMQGDIYYFEDAYHELCMMGCHMEEENATTTCIGCHQR